MDRFAMRLSLGYVSLAQEIEILRHHAQRQMLDACATAAEITLLKQTVSEVRISFELQRYIVQLVQATRNTQGVQIGASPRASLALMQAAKALALFDGLDFVTPEHIQELASAVIAHRLKLDSQARFSGLQPDHVVSQILREIPIPI
jgi:MoxR-like ATPase